MTREEAIEVLKLVDENASCDDCLYYAQMEDCPTDEDCIIRQALDMAIQALSQEPCTDAVSRVNAVRCVLSSLFLVEASEKIEKLPSVTQKSGKWIEKEGWDGDVYYECSMCGESFCLIDGTPTDNMYNYCPNCGAKMESEDKE